MTYPYDNLISIIFKEAYVSFLLRARSKAARSCYPLLLSSGYFLYKDGLRGMWHPRSIHTTSRQTVKKSHSGKHLWYRGSCSSQRVVGIWRNCMVSLHIILHIPIPKKLFLSLLKLPDLRLKTALYTTFPYES